LNHAVIHLLAMAHRSGIPLELDRFDELARRVPVLANIRPAGKYLMEDFYYAGGLPALLVALGDLLVTSARTVSGATLGEDIAGAQIFNAEVIHGRDDPLVKSDALVVLRGNLAPDGAVLKPPAAEARLLKHRGPAVVFDSYDEMTRRMDDPQLAADESSVFILRNAGPKGGPGMPEWGQLPVPKKLLQKGVRDVLRISDARMSGTSYGACVLHVAPEAFVGGPLALVEEGDIIELDVAARKLDMLVSDDELARRRAAWTPPKPQFPRGYGQMFSQHIKQANEGCDFDFLETGFGGLRTLGCLAHHEHGDAKRRRFFLNVSPIGKRVYPARSHDDLQRNSRGGHRLPGAATARRVAVNAGEEVGGIDIPLRSILPVTVSGRVISSLALPDASTTPPSALLMLVRRDNSVPENARNVGTVGLNPTSGSFEIRDILPGSYELFGRVQDPRGTPGANGLAPMAWGRASTSFIWIAWRARCG